ncbi:MAG: glycosyltransferase [Chloroflexota bacterium]
MYQGKKVGVVVPAYNEEKLIGPTLETIPAFVDRIYMIDDGSTDATPEVIRRFTDPRFFTITRCPGEAVCGGGASLFRAKKQPQRV